MRISNPRSIRLRIKRAPLISLGMITIFVPFLGLLTNTAASEMGLPGVSWRLGAALWLITVALVPIYFLIAPRIRRAQLAYTLIWLVYIPSGVAMLDGALRLSLVMLGPGSTLVFALSFLVGLATLPLTVRYRRQQFRAAIAEGHLSRSFDREQATWDAQYDHDADLSKEWLTRPGCLIRLLPWIGPIIGMRLADTFGRSTANLIMVVGFLSLGYLFVYLGLTRLAVDLLEFRKLEKEVDSPILLAQESSEPISDRS
jgi:hypothetical protein